MKRAGVALTLAVRGWLTAALLVSASAAQVVSASATQAQDRLSVSRATVDVVAWALAEQVRLALTGPSAEGVRGELRVEVRDALDGAPRGEALVAALTGPTIAGLRVDARFSAVEVRALDATAAGDGTDVAASAAAHDGYDALLRLVVETRGNFLVARGALWRTSRGGWRALFRAAPLQLGAPFMQVRLDAELRQYVGALPQVTAETVVARALRLPGRGYVALAAADLDDDGRSELLLVHAESVEVVRLTAGALGRPLLEPVASAAFGAGLPRASSRPRRAIGTATSEGHSIALRTSELAATVRARLIDGALTLDAGPTPCDGDAYPLSDACARAVPGHDQFAPRLAARESGVLGPDAAPGPRGRPSGPVALAGFYARSARSLRHADGTALLVEAVVTPAGRLAVQVGGRPGGAVSYGTALALADLEDDGLAELLTSGAGPTGEGDHLALLRVRDSAQVVAVWQSDALPGDVWVAASADLDDDGLEELLAVEEPAPGSTDPARLWVVR